MWLTERFGADRAAEPVSDAERHARDLAEFDVPPPGGKPSNGKTRQAAMRLGVPVAILMAISGLAYGCGVQTGSARVPAQGAISQQDALRFRLTTFPVDLAATFAQRYLQICLNHPAASDLAAARTRLSLLTQMGTGGIDPGCGYSDTATSAANGPRSIEFTGQMKSVQAGYDVGGAAFLTFQVIYSDDRLVNVVLPVWVDDKSAPTPSMRIVGSLGFMPVTNLGAPPAYTENRTKDANLAGKLSQSVLAPFLSAWGSSDTQQLGLVLTADASATAKAGLRGILTDPSVGQVVVFTNHSTGEDPEIHYSTGDEVLAQTSVQWISTVAGSKQAAVYQIRLRLVQGKWAVVDITGSALDPTGGAVQSQSSPTTTKSAASTTPSVALATTTAALPTLPPPAGN